MLSATVVLDGQVVGTWKRTIKRDRIVLQVAPFSGLDHTEEGAVAAAANRYGQFMNMAIEL